MLAAEWVGLTFALLPWGFAVDRFGERWTLATGLGACAGFLVGAAYAPGFLSLVVRLGRQRPDDGIEQVLYASAERR